MKIYSKDLVTGEIKYMGEIPIEPAWVMADEQRNQLTSLAQQIALSNGLSMSIHIDKDGLNIGLYRIDDKTSEEKPEIEHPASHEYQSPHHQILNRMARELSELDAPDRESVIAMARNRAEDDPAKRLALEVSKLNGYALGTFMQYLMSFGHDQ